MHRAMPWVKLDGSLLADHRAMVVCTPGGLPMMWQWERQSHRVS